MKARRIRAFTLVELLVSMAVLVLLALVLVSIVQQTSLIWRASSNKIEQFTGARNAFESITRRLSQATLNTYWGYEPVDAPVKYVRSSDLRFVSGSASMLIEGSANDPTLPSHGIFFQAPLGYSTQSNFVGLDNLLNTWGYYIKFDTDKNTRPPFINAVQNLNVPERYRYRLMELMQPSEKLTIYAANTGWIGAALGATPTQVHVLAENIIALVFLPKLSPQDEQTLNSPPTVPGTALSPNYAYDSTLTYNGTSAPPAADAATLDPQNQPPPLVQVTLVAIDEVSAIRLAQNNGSNPPDLGVGGVFDATMPNSASKYQNDLNQLEQSLARSKINYRVFITQVILRTAKWSRD